MAERNFDSSLSEAADGLDKIAKEIDKADVVGIATDQPSHTVADYRVAHLLNECEGVTFKITNVVDGDVIVIGDNGMELRLPLKLPRKIIVNDPETVTVITKMGISIRKKSEKQMKLDLQDRVTQ